MSTRRTFLRTSAAATLGSSLTHLGLTPLRAEETELPKNAVRFTDDIEPLVQQIENTPREQLMEQMAFRVRDGLSYQQLLAGLFLAGVRNVQPRPSVGFKFHAVLVVNSAHLASVASRDTDRWLPLFWALDNFKGSQARDVREGDWTMASVDEAKVPTAERARAQFVDAMERWDEQQADAAVTGFHRSASANQVFEVFARYGIRDFRSIGHKAIFVANSYRTLQCIGWQYAEPVLRSLAYALQNHEGQPNPAENDLENDRPWRKNLERVKNVRPHWQGGRLDDKSTTQLVHTLRTGSSDDACEQVIEMLDAGVSPQSIYDALFLSASELLMRQPGIVALHALTSTNAFRFAFNTVADDNTRLLALLQNAAFLPMFRQAMHNRGDVGDASILELEPAQGDASLDGIFTNIGSDNPAAARSTLRFLQDGGRATALMNEARRYVFLKGRDSHDYKFSSAVLEDFYQVSPQWRNRFLAASVYKLSGSGSQDNGLVDRIRSALNSSTG